jgi:hypothetical protein
LEVLEDRAKKGRLTPEVFAQSEVAQRIGITDVQVINAGLRTNPVGTIQALRAALQRGRASVETNMPPAAKPAVTPPQEPSGETAAVGMPTVEVPLKDLTLSKDVPQFKMGADDKGVVEPLGGKFERTGVAPIQVWRRNDGRLEVISGRHRLDLARRSGEKSIPAQIHDEAQGFTPQMAAVLDAELNIRDGQGKVKDYVNYFKASGITPQDAESRGLLARATGKRAFTVASQGSDELVAAIRNDQVPDEAAYFIALNAPNDSRLQGVGLQAVMDGKSANIAVNTMQAVKALGIENNTTTDMFGFDDSALKEAQAMAQVAARKQREIQTRLSAISGAAKNPAIAKAEGIDIRDPNAVNQRIQELRQAKAAWDNWSTNPDLIGEIRQARGVQAPELTLRGETEEEIRAREEAAAAEEQRLRAEEGAARQAEQQAAERARADETVGLFELGQTPEQQLSGMGDLFASQEPAVAKEEPAETKIEPTGKEPPEIRQARREMEQGVKLTPAVLRRRKALIEWEKSQEPAPAKVPEFTAENVINGEQPPADLPANQRLILMPCSAKKGGKAGPAADLYQGVFFQTYRSNVTAAPNMVILSAEHGFISPTEEIAPYDRLLDKARADEMLGDMGKLIGQLKEAMAGIPMDQIKDVLLVGGKEYQGVMRAALASLKDDGLIPEGASVNATSGGIGEQRQQLGQYLRAIPVAKEEPAEEGRKPGATDDEVKKVGDVFEKAQESQTEDDFEMHHLFDPPAKGEVVRLTEKEDFLTPEQAKAKIAEWRKNAEEQGKKALSEGKMNPNSDKVVLSLFDLTGAWSEPWVEAGYQVYRFDIQDKWTMTDETTGEEVNLGDINQFSVQYFQDLFGDFEGNDVYAILAACPCTDFASSGARHFKAKDASGQTLDSINLVKKTLAVIEYWRPSIWAIENPVGRIEKLGGLPPWRLSFEPYMFGDPYTKKTLLWGRFNADLPTAPVEPTEGSKMHRMYGGKSLATKNARSVTPEGFAYSFFQANNAIDNPVMAIANKYDRLDRDLIQKAVDAGLTERDINDLVQDPYYFYLDDEAAENALRTAIEEGPKYFNIEPDLQSEGYGYHAGDGQYARDTVLGRMAGRGTGHFGTGVYMYSSKQKIKASSRANRPIIKIDLSKYTLATPRDAEYAQLLHDGLRMVNDFPTRERDIRQAAINIWMGTLYSHIKGETVEDIYQVIQDAVKEAQAEYEQVAHTNAYVDSASTRVMKRLGYDGIDVRHIPEFDTGEYGTVVYEQEIPDQTQALKSERPSARDQIVSAMRRAKESVGYVNCKLVLQLATGIPKLENLPKVKTAKVGDIYAFGIQHYAVNIGDGMVADVPEWGADVEIKPLATVTAEYDQPTAIHRPPANAYSAELGAFNVEPTPATIRVNGVERPTTNSDGLPIYPTERGTQNFWKWFGDSVVVDSQDRPVVLYHSTYSDVETFTINFGADEYFRFGAHVGPVEAAENRLEVKAAEDRQRNEPSGTAGANVMPVYVKAQNPLRLTENRLGRWGVDDIMQSIMETADKGQLPGVTASMIDAYYDDNLKLGNKVWQNESDWKPGEKSKALSAFLKGLGYDSIVYENKVEGGGDSYLLLDSSQLKSATGNIGTFEGPSIIANIEPGQAPITVEFVTRAALIREEQLSELQSLRQRLAAIPRKVAEQRIQVGEPLIIKSMLERAADLKHALLMSRERRDSPEQFLARALKEYDDGNISEEVLNVIKAAYDKQPGLLNGLLLSVKQAPEGMDRAAGSFLPMKRIVRLYKASSGVTNPSTIRHELTHTLEQMMTPEQRVVMVEQWQKALDRAIAKHQDEKHQKYFEAVLNFLDKPTAANYQKAISLLPSYEMYQYISPSEYWAVNAEPLMASQLGGHWQRFKMAVRRLFEGLKSVFGFDNNYAVHKTFRDIMTGSKERITKDMLADYVMDVTGPVQNIEDPAKKLAEKYPHPNVPILDKTPIKSALLQTWSNSKDLFKLFLDDPVEAASELGDVTFDAITQLRMEAFWFGAGLESRDFNRYGGQLRTSQGLAVASVALDNALYSNQIGIEVIFQGGLGFNPRSGRFTAVESPLGMRGVYEAEQRLAKQLGDQLAANTINRYLEAKRSISIMNELYDRENNYQEAKADLERLVNEGASEDIIDSARDAVAEAQAELKSINKAVTSVLMSEQEMEDSAALNKVYPELREIQQNWNAINQNLLRVWFDVGLLSKKRYEALSSIEDYVPWNRIMNDGEDPHASVEATTKNLVTIGRERLLKSGAPMETIDRKGKDGKKILDEQGNIVAHVFQVRPSTLLRVTVDGKRVPKKYLAITADQKIQINLPIDDGSLVQFQTTLPINNIIGNMTDNVMRMTVNAIRHYAAARIVNEYATRSPDGKLLTFPKADKKKGRVPYIQNGRKVFVEIPDPLVAGAMYGLDGLDVKMFSAMAAMANIVRRTITLDPSFQLRQILQDSTSAAVVTGVKRPDKLIGGVLVSFSKSLVAPAGKAVGFKTDPSINVLKAIGVGGFHSPSRTPEAEIKRRLGIMNRNVYHATIKVLDHIGDASAMGQPLATYNRVMAETGDEMQAQYQASTVFPVLRRGKNKLAIAVSRTVAFANAYAAQIDILINQLLGGNLQGRSRVETWLRLGVATTGLATTTLIYCMLVGGDPDYEELDDQTKMKNFIIPGTDIKIPMNNSAAYFWKAVPEMLYNRILKEGTKNEMDATRVSDALFTAAMDSLLGPQPIPTGPRAALEVIFDHSFLTGRELIPQNLKRLEAYAQWDASTSELGKMISNGTELPNGKRVLSPIEADHFVRGLFGTVGIVSQWAVNSIYEGMGERPATAAQKVPLLGGFTLPKVGRLNEDLFYDLKERADQKYDTWNRHIARGETKEAAEYMKEHSGLIAMHDYTSQVSSDLSELNQLIRYYGEYKKSVLSPELRRQKIESLQKTKQKILSSVQSQRRAAGL